MRATDQARARFGLTMRGVGELMAVALYELGFLARGGSAVRRVLLGKIHFTQIDNCTAIRLAAQTLARAMGDPETGVLYLEELSQHGENSFSVGQA